MKNQNQHDVSPILVIDDITPERAVYLRDGYPVPVIGERIWLSSVSETADSDERASIAYARTGSPR